MGIVINPRGPAGSGKTEFVRRILADYGWPSSKGVEPVYQKGRARPIAYRLAHPCGGRPLAVLGQYEGSCGGCDTIGRRDGGLDRVFRLVEGFFATGHDVLLEGLVLSCEHGHTDRFARSHPLHILHLDTPADRCIRNLIARRNAGRAGREHITRKVVAEHAQVAAACARLTKVATVTTLPFEAALLHTRGLLGLEATKALM